MNNAPKAHTTITDRPDTGRWITLTEAAKLLPRIDGRKVAVSTLWRWCRKGLRGVTLEYTRVGRRICTSHQALLRFFTQLAEHDDRRPPKTPAHLTRRRPISARRRQRQLAAADRALEEAGI